MAKPRKYTIDLNLTLAVSAEDDYEARDYIEDFLNALQYVASSDDPDDDHYRILASKFYWLSFTDHGEIEEGEF
jgi:hypothetical protein